MDLEYEVKKYFQELMPDGEKIRKEGLETAIIGKTKEIVGLELTAAKLTESGIEKKKTSRYTEAKNDFMEAAFVYKDLLDEHIPDLYKIMQEKSNPLDAEDRKEYREQKQTCSEGLIQSYKFIGDVFDLEGNPVKAKDVYRQAIGIFQATEDPSLFSKYLAGLMIWLCRDKSNEQSVREHGYKAATYYEECVRLGKDAQKIMDRKAFLFSCEVLGHFCQGVVPGLRDDEKAYSYFCLATDGGLDCSDQLKRYKRTIFGKIKFLG